MIPLPYPDWFTNQMIKHNTLVPEWASIQLKLVYRSIQPKDHLPINVCLIPKSGSESFRAMAYTTWFDAEPLTRPPIAFIREPWERWISGYTQQLYWLVKHDYPLQAWGLNERSTI